LRRRRVSRPARLDLHKILAVTSLRLKSLVLLAVLLWQALVGLTPPGVEWRAGELSHLQVHGQDVDHHHHHDQSLHLEADADEPPHHHAHPGTQPPALAPGLLTWHPDPLAPARVAVVRSGHTGHVPEGLLRPPQATDTRV
jgi:hypothetical protein